MRENVHQGRAQRCQPDPPGDEDDVHPHAVVEHVPTRAVGSSHVEQLARLRVHEGMGHAADVTYGVLQHGGRTRVAADRDRHLADAEQAEHRVLAGLERQRDAVVRLELQGHGVVGLMTVGEHPERPRLHRVDQRRPTRGAGGGGHCGTP